MIAEAAAQHNHVPFEDTPGAVYRVLGPPGTGKTSWLVSQAERAVETYGPSGVRVVSMTRAASAEFARRASPVPPENISTLHALAYRALERPVLLEDKDRREWNEGPGRGWAELSTWQLDASEGIESARIDVGDAFLMDLDLLRARRQRPQPGSELARFAREYEGWKAEVDRVDFTDLLERALDEVPTAPGMPDALFVDEAQDLSSLELELVESWGRRCRAVVLVGDADQAIYSWRGADPGVLLGAPPFKVHEQSHRIPRAVYDRAMGVIRRSSTWSRAAYRPRPVDGIARRLERAPTAVADDYEAMLEVAPPNGWGGDELLAMLLGSCGYMVTPFVAEMRKRRVPYGNPFRNEWSPLARGSRGRTTPADRIAAFSALATPRDWKLSVDVLRSARSGGPVIGSKAEVAALAEDATPLALASWIARVLHPSALEHFERTPGEEASTDDLQWWLGAMTGTRAKAAEYAVGCAIRWGVEETIRPRLCIGTIHSVKGGEALAVYLMTGLSRAGREQRLVPGWDGEDAIYRQFYVGVTRAREQLVIVGPQGAAGNEWEVAV